MPVPRPTSEPSPAPAAAPSPRPGLGTASRGAGVPARHRSLGRRIAFWCFAAGFVFLVLEITTRLLWEQPPDRVGAQLIGSGLFSPDPATGWRANANFEFVHHLYANPDYTIRTNTRGLRCVEHAVENPGGKARVVVLGDSYAFGYGVEDEQTFARRLAADEPGIEVINLGVTGYNLAQSHALLVAEGLRYTPRLVVLALCQNDITDQAIPTVRQIVADPPAQDRPPEPFRLHEMSRLVDFVRYFAAAIRPLRRTLQAVGLKEADGGYESLDTNLRPSLIDYPPVLRDQWVRTVAELEALQATCARAGAKLLVATIPPTEAVVPGALTRTLRYVGYTEADFDLRKAPRALAAVCERLGVAFCDTYDALSSGDDRYFLKFDMHLNAAGHRRYAEALREPVRALLAPR